MNAIDTNILAYTFDPAVPTKQVRARQVVSDLVLKPDETVTLWQVESLRCFRCHCFRAAPARASCPIDALGD